MGDTLVLGVSGELDLATRDLLRSVFAEVRGAPPARLVVDLRGLRFVDVSGLSLLLWFANSCRGGGPVIEFVPAPEHVHDAFEIAGVADRLPFTTSFTEPPAAQIRVA